MFRQKRGKARAGGKWMTKVPVEIGVPVKRVLVEDKFTAEKMEEMTTYLGKRQAWDVLRLVTAPDAKYSVPELYALWQTDGKRIVDGQMIDKSDDEKLLLLRKQLDGGDFLDPLVDEWNLTNPKRGYYGSVRLFIPKGSKMRLVDFRQKAVINFLHGVKSQHRSNQAGSDIGTQTKRNRKSGISSFAEWLMGQEKIEQNPTAGIRLRDTDDEREARLEHYTARVLTMAQAQQLVEATEDPERRALYALMAGSMIEWSACARLLGQDVDHRRRMVHAKGLKKKTRWRWIEVAEDWAWPHVEAWTRGFQNRPHDHVFTVTGSAALGELKATQSLLKLPDASMHDLRHTFAVKWVQEGALGGRRTDGKDKAWLKNQAGHLPNSNMIETTYGVFDGQAKLRERKDAELREAEARKEAEAVAKELLDGHLGHSKNGVPLSVPQPAELSGAALAGV